MSDAEIVKCDLWNGELLAGLDVMGEGLFGRLDKYEPPAHLYRLTAPDAPRLYFARNPVRVYPSVTSVLHTTCPTSLFLIRWIAAHGQRRAEFLRDERAAYGTCMHHLFSEYLQNRSFDLSGMSTWVEMYTATEKLEYDTAGWPATLQQDLVGFTTFCQQYNARPVGVEVPLASDRLGYAGTLDMVAILDLGPRRKDILAYVDWKSNREYFYDDQEIQVNAYKSMWNDLYPTTPITHCFLYAPNDWDEGSRQRFRFKDCTQSKLKDAFPGLVEQFKLRNPERDKVLRVDGVISLDTDPGSVVKFKKIEDIIGELDNA